MFKEKKKKFTVIPNSGCVFTFPLLEKKKKRLYAPAIKHKIAWVDKYAYSKVKHKKKKRRR